MCLAGEDVAKLHILSETTKKVRFILHHPYATPHPLPAPLNRHRRRRFADVVEVGRPTSTMSVLEVQLKPPNNLSKEGRRSGREWETSVLAKTEEYRQGKTHRINSKAELAQFLDRL